MNNISIVEIVDLPPAPHTHCPNCGRDMSHDDNAYAVPSVRGDADHAVVCVECKGVERPKALYSTVTGESHEEMTNVLANDFALTMSKHADPLTSYEPIVSAFLSACVSTHPRMSEHLSEEEVIGLTAEVVEMISSDVGGLVYDVMKQMEAVLEADDDDDDGVVVQFVRRKRRP